MAEGVPVGTYRVQLNGQFGFDQAAAIVPYLAKLGVSHLYCSPYLQAGRGSTHGYDVLDHNQLSQELGGSAAHGRLVEELRSAGMSQVLDIVPNHMTIVGGHNALWWDVLKNGPSSSYAGFFDIDWQSPFRKLAGKVLLPLLHDQYGLVLQSKEIQLKPRGDELCFEYRGLMFPLSSRSRDSLPSGPQLDAQLEAVNKSQQRLHDLLEQQHYRLAWWRTAGSEINYRRFFSIDSLAAIRVEQPEVFERIHAAVLKWLRQGWVEGLRVDHPDGLYDPLEYLQRLKERAPATWIVVEKILAPDESLPSDWPVSGTTGYDFLNKLGGLYVDPAGQEQLDSLYAQFTGEGRSFTQIAHDSRLMILEESFGGELERLAVLLENLAQEQIAYRDFSRRELRAALAELIACFPVYRTYAQAHLEKVSPQDMEIVSSAIASAAGYRDDLDQRLWELIHGALGLCWPGKAQCDFVMRFQQLTGPVAAKGIEDTAFYRYYRLACLNEVGGDPGKFGTSLQEFHDFCGRLQRDWPQTMIATSTHDTKRSEDVRVRIALISEVPDLWAQAVTTWRQMNMPLRPAPDLPTRQDEYLLYQTLVGAYPIDDERLSAYMLKAAREAKQRTSWQRPDHDYEKNLGLFVQGILRHKMFIQSLREFLEAILWPSQVSSLSQTLVKCTAPGVPDFYQGTELWDISLVDPDNRRPVDYDIRKKLLEQLPKLDLVGVLDRMDDGLPKLLVIAKALALRKRMPHLFGQDSSYVPMSVQGSRADHLLAFCRGGGVITIVPRRTVRLNGDWRDTSLQLPPGRWRDEFSANEFDGLAPLENLLKDFPVALLVKPEVQL